MGKWLRLDKYLADMGMGTRSQLKEIIRKGRVSVNGSVIRSPEQKVALDQDRVEVDGAPVGYAEMEYYMLHKPAGVISATEDARQKTVLDLIDTRQRRDLFPVGRLDADTEGLLLITNDGALAHRLLSPKHHVDKVYYVEVDRAIPGEAEQRFADGIPLEDGTVCLPAVLRQETEKSAFLTIQEGKFHQVKRMFSALGCRVIYLKRVAMGPLVLDETLPCGAYRSLTQEELQRLREHEGRRKESHSAKREETYGEGKGRDF